MAKAGDNLKGIKAAIVQADKDIGDIESQRDALTDEIGAVMDKLERMGISRHAMRFARRYMKYDENERRSLDTAYTVCREALGAPVQGDLLETISEFAEAKKAEDEKAKQKAAAKSDGGEATQH